MKSLISLPLCCVFSFILCCCGCQWPLGSLASSSSGEATTSAAVVATDVGHPTVLARRSVGGLSTHEKDMIAVLDELEAIAAIDPAAKQQLMDDLREAKQENWPYIVQQFKSALAYRQQLIAKEKESIEKKETVPQQIIASKRVPPPEVLAEEKAREPAPPALPPSPPVAAPAKVHAAMVTDLPDPYPSTSTPQVIKTEQVNYLTTSPSQSSVPGPLTWEEHLAEAIGILEQQTSEMPRSTDEVHLQMRLRMLRFLAGREDEALQPIPGAPPAMQDYWSKQLFALSTFLDNHRQPDDKSRAAGSLMHIDQARAKLAELALLQVRNLTLVENVEGYGVYKRLENASFKPGDQVSLYAEVENFRSTSTPDGYQTRLGTSYEVVDLNGQRVVGKAFPDVSDLCQNIRRDFHMQYGIHLPTRIYPGKYELRLVITDQQSHKIGQATVPFEIVE